MEIKMNKRRGLSYTIIDFLWVIAFCPKEIQFVVIFLLTFFLWAKHPFLKIKQDSFILTYIIVTAIYAFSIVMSLLMGQHEMPRVFATFNTLAITILGIILYQVYQQNNIEKEKIQKSMFRNMCILIFIWILFILIQEKGNALSFLPGPLCGSDWSNGVIYTRFCGYLEYENLIVYMHLFSFGLSFDYVKRQYGKFGASIYAVISLFPVVSARSRVGILGCVLVVAISILFMNWQGIAKFWIHNKREIIILLLISILIIGIIGKDFFISIYERMMLYRAGSSETRLAIYTDSINKMLSESPIWGCGVKDIWYLLPYGSHSTFIGMYFKTGIVGGTIFTVGMLVSVLKTLFFKKTYDLYRLSMNLSLVGVLVVSLFEDLDGADWNFAIFMIFTSLVFKENCKTTKMEIM